MLLNKPIHEHQQRQIFDPHDSRCQYSAASTGWIVVHPHWTRQLHACGLHTLEDYLHIPGVIVTGHPDRHVRRVHLPGLGYAYLKRQHYVTYRERWRNWCQGYGWVSRSVREGRLLQVLSRYTQNIPQWLAYGENHHNQAFLLVASLEDAIDLHHWLRNHKNQDLRPLARQIGKLIAQLHDFGFTTPDLTAKHIFVKSTTQQIAIVDWASCRQCRLVPLKERLRALASLDASVSRELIGVRERWALLSAALQNQPRESSGRNRLSRLARWIDQASQQRCKRSSLRDQRHGEGEIPELIWLAQEAICVTTEAARWWPHAAAAPPFYGISSGDTLWTLPSGETGYLLRGCSFLGMKGWWNRLRWRPLPSPAQRWARLLIHLQRHKVPAPRLLAFGHRPRSWHSVEWFVLCAPYSVPCSFDDDRLLKDLGRLLRRLHHASCLLIPSPDSLPFGIISNRLYINQIRRVFYDKNISDRKIRKNIHAVLDYFPKCSRKFIIYGYEKLG